MRGWQRMDRDIQKKIRQAEASGDREEIREAYESANTAYATGTGVVLGGIVGSILFPGVGTVVGAAIGGILGNKVSKE